MAYIAPTTKSTGTLITAAIWNADVVANEIAIYAGGLSVTSQAIGDILYASSTTQFARVAAVAAGQILASAGTGTVPAYSATPALTSVDMGGTTVYGSRAITVDTGGVLNVVLASSAGDDFTVDTDKLVVEGDTGLVTVGGDLTTGGLIKTTAGGILNQGSAFLRVEGTGGSVPTGSTGAGLDIYAGNIASYNRTTAAYAPIAIAGSTFAVTSATNFSVTAAGNVTVGGDVSLAATKKLYLDGGSNTYIREVSADVIQFVTGAADGVWVGAGGLYVGAYNGDNHFTDASAGGGSATLYIGNQSITTSSDRRLKANIVDSSLNAVEALNRLRVTDYNWNDPSDTSFNNRNARGLWTGLIAQEVVEHLPFAVNAPRDEEKVIDHGSDSTWSIESIALCGVLVKAVQELSARIESLES